jgi:hypothetical protein
MRYKDNVDYLFASIMYLGTHSFWWARSPQAMARELQLDEARLQRVFDAFPGIYRKSYRTNPETHQHFYSLQARYAQREGGDVDDPEQESCVKPLAPDKLEVVVNFVLKMAEQEAKDDDRLLGRTSSLRTNIVAACAAILSAFAAIAVATITYRPK